MLAIVLPLVPALAQKRKAVAKKTTAPVTEVVEDTKIEEMLEATQQIMFIDSIVVDKQEFLNFYRLTSEAGTISTYNLFFHSNNQPYSTVYVNQLGNKCWFSDAGSLYTIDKLDGQWSEPAPLEGLGRFQNANYPFMLSDGLTLYFSAISSDGLGGLDIYVSRYDSEAGKFLLAENLGLPFNSEANDYMYAVDEFNDVGYFATDRRQPEGKVCIYTFIPNQKRITYSSDDYDESVIRSRAKIERIADTWGDGTQRAEILNRLYSTEKGTPQEKKQQEFLFIVNDNMIYTKLTDFQNPENRERIAKLNDMRKSLKSTATEIEKVRIYYATKASKAEKEGLKAELLAYEQEYYQLELEIRQLENTIRHSELKTMR